MRTELININPEDIDPEKVRRAAEILRKGGLVAFPTETVYGLGADALNPHAVSKIFQVKGRPPDNPLIIHIGMPSYIRELAVDIPDEAETLMKTFWPGPLTLVLKKSSLIPEIVNAGLNTVAIRMPSNKIALSLIKEAKVPIAAPSANLSTMPSPTCAEHVINDLDGKIEAIIDGGATNIGVESTVIDLTASPITLLRPGGVTFEELQVLLGKNNVRKLSFIQTDAQMAPKSPGMKYRHYSPKAEVILVKSAIQNAEEKIQEIVDNFRKKGCKVGIMTIKETQHYNADEVIFIGSDFETIARNIFKTFRTFDKKNMDIVIVEGVEERKLGLAIMNRLRKAAKRIINV